MKRTLFALLAGSFVAFNGMAQEVIPCGTDAALENLHNQYPQLKAEYEARQLLNNSQVVTTTVENGVEKKTTQYIVPVVFHILHEYGAENISDAAVYALMEDLNEDYSATNADLSQVIPMFDTIVGNASIEFRLAALDPYGNCTNGIEHIYSHETNNGETVSKLNQWDRSHYMNIWVVHSPNSGGPIQGTLLGYATFPASTDGSGFWTDGIVLRDYTVTNNDRTLSHEAGHYFGLAHPFNGVQNIGDPAECGDDGIIDTPPTEGSFSTCNLNLPTCDTSVAELPLANVQNIMDYSSCAVMFTEDQCTAMNNTIEGIAGQRSTLWQDSTLMATGVKDLLMPQDPTDPLTVPICPPVADFHAADKFVCVGSNVSFEDHSWNAVIDSRSWTFQDGTPATSTSANPSVSFSSPGWKEVTLTVTNSAGSDTRDETRYIYVSADGGDNYGPTSFDMETENTWATGTGFFLVNNIEDNYGSFGVVSGSGYDGTKAFKLQTYKDISNADPFTAEFFYNARLGGSVDQLITPSIDMRYMSNVEVSFKFAYATNATVASDITEELRVYTSKDCGETWTPRVVQVEGQTVGSTISGDDLVTAGYASNADFAPTTNTQWATATFSYNPTSQDNNTRIMFEFTASDVASNLYIDNINVDGILGVTDPSILDMELSVFPNPSAGEAINVAYMAQDEVTTFTLRDAQGKIIAQQTVDATNAPVNTTLNGTENLPSACYFLEVSTGDHSIVEKVVVM